MISTRITQTEETIRKLEEQQVEQENNLQRDCAGGVRCLSCGSVRKGYQIMHVTADPNLDLSPAKNAGGDYDQLVAVLNRQAGLKPLSRQTKPLLPMTPIARPASTAVVSPILKKGQGASGLKQEPLYRRAKAVSLMKEIPKIPMVSFGPGPGHPADIYHFDQEVTQSNQSPNNRVRLPKVSSSNHTGTY